MQFLKFFPFVILVSFLASCTTGSGTLTGSNPVDSTQQMENEMHLENVWLLAGYGAGSSWFDVFFTDPLSPFAHEIEGGPDEKLASAIDAARLSVDAAIYNLDLWSVRDALLNAHRRGLTVRLVVDSDNMDQDEIQDLIAAGIPVLGDRRESLMHDKFVIIDRREVWTGSMNFTVSGGYFDNNDLICIRSENAAELFLEEFREMFEDDRFGDDSVTDHLQPSLEVNGTDIEIYFSPEDHPATRLVELISAAEESIYFMAFSFTSDDLGSAIIERGTEGVKVAGVMESEQVRSNEGSEYESFRNAGLDVVQDGNENQMHHKVILIDSRIVITGSYNFSRSAEERNDENVVILFSPTIAAQYFKEFLRIYGQSQRTP